MCFNLQNDALSTNCFDSINKTRKIEASKFSAERGINQSIYLDDDDIRLRASFNFYSETNCGSIRSFSSQLGETSQPKMIHAPTCKASNQNCESEQGTFKFAAIGGLRMPPATIYSALSAQQPTTHSTATVMYPPPLAAYY